MLQQTLIKVVTPVYESFIEKFPSVGALAKAEEDEIRRAVKGLGYYRRFRLMHQAARELQQRSQGKETVEWPNTLQGLLALPGVGPYTAAAVGSIAFDLPEPVVDGNVQRILCRLFAIGKAVNDSSLKSFYSEVSAQLVSQRFPGDFNQALMELGQKICRPSGKPACDLCPVNSSCRAFQSGNPERYPLPKVVAAKIPLGLKVIIHRSSQGLIGIGPRSENIPILKDLEGFETEVIPDSSDGSHGKGPSALFQRQDDLRYLGRFRHSVTKWKIQAEVWLQSRSIPRENGNDRVKWLPEEVLPDYLTSSFDQKAWKICLEDSTFQDCSLFPERRKKS